MPRSGKSDRRVLIMDDVTWSEAPHRRSEAEVEDLAPASWVAQDDWRLDRGLADSEGLTGSDDWLTSTRRPSPAGRVETSGRSSSDSRPVTTGAPSAAGRGILDAPADPPVRAAGPQVIAEFDWTSADAHAIEDRIWGTGRPARVQSDTAGPAPLPALEAEVPGDDETLWGPRPRLIADEPGGRRTVVITGRMADRYVAPRRGRDESLPAHHRWAGMGNADRMALYAVALGVLLVLVAALSAH